MNKRIVFTAEELKALSESPAALRALANYHEVQITMAEASDWPCDGNIVREVALRVEAFRLETQYANGDGPDFDKED
jgi:hypothetical protein